MEVIKDLECIKMYYRQYNMERLFSVDLLEKFELIKANTLEYICKQEEKMEHLYFLVEGKAKVFNALANGKTLLISFYEPFEVIGDVELIKFKPAIATVQALSDCYMLALSTEKLRPALQKDIKLLNFVCTALAEKLDHISNNSSINLLYPLENRLASYINMVATEEKAGQGRRQRYFNENLTQLAELLGISYRHLLRTLKTLCNRGILSREKKGYMIQKEEELKSLAGDLYK